MKKQEEVVYPSQYILNKDIVIPKGTVLNNVDGETMYFGKGMYEAHYTGDEPIFVYVDSDILHDNKRFLKEVK